MISIPSAVGHSPDHDVHKADCDRLENSDLIDTGRNMYNTNEQVDLEEAHIENQDLEEARPDNPDLEVIYGLDGRGPGGIASDGAARRCAGCNDIH